MSALQKISVSSLADIAFDKLVEAITSGEFKPGERLSEAMLARQFGISRGPLREALGRLEGRLVVRQPRLGVSVIDFSKKAIKESFAVREALEGMAARLAADNMSAAEIDDLKEALKKHAKDPALVKGAAYYPTPLAQNFHFMIVRGSKNHRLIEILLDQLRLQIWLHRFKSKEAPGHAKRAWQEHAEIVEALASRNADKAEQLMRQHIRSYYTNFLSQFRDGDDEDEAPVAATKVKPAKAAVRKKKAG